MSQSRSCRTACVHNSAFALLKPSPSVKYRSLHCRQDIPAGPPTSYHGRHHHYTLKITNVKQQPSRLPVPTRNIHNVLHPRARNPPSPHLPTNPCLQSASQLSTSLPSLLRQIPRVDARPDHGSHRIPASVFNTKLRLKWEKGQASQLLTVSTTMYQPSIPRSSNLHRPLVLPQRSRIRILAQHFGLFHLGREERFRRFLGRPPA